MMQELRAILERLHALRQAAKNQHFKNYHPPSNIISVPALHRHRDTNVNIDQRKWLSFQGTVSLYYCFLGTLKFNLNVDKLVLF